MAFANRVSAVSELCVYRLISRCVPTKRSTPRVTITLLLVGPFWVISHFTIRREHGLTPATHFIESLRSHFGDDPYSAFIQYPTLFWFIPPTSGVMQLFAALGVFLATIVCILGAGNTIIMVSLWLLYISIVNVGQTWYSFGWESQLLGESCLSILHVL